MATDASDSHMCLTMPAKTALAGDKRKNREAMRVRLHIRRKRFSIFKNGQFEHSIQPIEHIAPLAECAAKNAPLCINQVQPETKRRHSLRGRNDYTKSTRSPDCKRPVIH